MFVFLFDQERLHRLAVGVLNRDEMLADQLLGQRLALRGVVGELDAAGLAAAAHHHLAFEHPRAGVLFDERFDFGGRGGEDALRGRNADAPEEVLALIFDQFHGPPPFPGGAWPPWTTFVACAYRRSVAAASR